MNNKNIYEYDMVIIGGGVSGCEAASVLAENGARVLLLSINTDSIGYMAFENFISKSEGINAVGKNIWNRLVLNNSVKKNSLDIKSISFLKKDFNEDKIFFDRKRQMISLKGIIEKQKNIETRQSLVIDIVLKENIYHTQTNDGTSYKSKSIIMAPGTFLNSNIFWGSYSVAAGRPGEITSKKLLINLKKIGFKFKRARLYSNPKIDIRSLNKKKYIKNADKHNLNLIPEGIETKELYINGIKTDKSEEEQLKELRKIKGMEDIVITRPGYGINYNVLSPLQINKNLESKKFPGLFFCGKINGTEKYEQIAAQGYLAGLNAYKKICI
jgi:tRNA U34 5-carboxymethylaminomethyl modifying enzyme MnmG/GidA